MMPTGVTTKATAATARRSTERKLRIAMKHLPPLS
jgi:hypothetical protein